MDAAVAATLLVEGVEKIGEHGVARQRLLKKLRKSQDVWGTWAEIRAADILLRTIGRDSTLHLEEGRSRGAHADLRFLPANLGVGQSVEVKAIGLSDREVDFCQRMAPALRRLLPPVGLSHGHASLDARAPVVTRDVRREGARQAKQAIKAVPRYPRGLRAAVVVGHGSEGDYARRVGRRVAQAVRQLPQGDECWVAIYWSNGAPMAAVGAAVPWAEIPSRVQGLIFVGCGVAFPDRQIHCYTSVLGRNAEVAEAMPIHSLMDQEELATLVLERFERSSGVRPTLLVVGRRDLVFRDGSRRILPFNLLLDADPSVAGRHALDPICSEPRW